MDFTNLTYRPKEVALEEPTLEDRLERIRLAESLALARLHDESREEILLVLKENDAKGVGKDRILELYCWQCYAWNSEAEAEKEQTYLHVREACEQFAIAVSHLTEAEIESERDTIKEMLDLTTRNDAKEKAWNEAMSQADRIDECHAAIWASIKEFNGCPTYFWRAFLENCKRGMEKVQRREKLPMTLDEELAHIASPHVHTLVLSSIIYDTFIAFEDEALMLNAHAYYLRSFLQGQQHTKEKCIKKAYRLAQFVTSEVRNIPLHQGVIPRINDAFLALSMHDIDIDMDGLRLGDGGDEVDEADVLIASLSKMNVS